MRTINNTMLFHLLENLDQGEWEELESYAASQMGKAEIWRGLRKIRKSMDGDLEAEAFMSAFNGKNSMPFSLSRYRKACFRIRELVLEFCAVKEVLADAQQIHLNALRYMERRAWANEIPGMQKRLARSSQPRPARKDDYPIEVFLGESLLDFQIRYQNANSGPALCHNWQRSEEWFLLQGLRYSCLRLDYLSQSGTASEENSCLPEEYLDRLLERTDLSAHPLVRCYAAIREMLQRVHEPALFEAAVAEAFAALANHSIARTELPEIIQLLLNEAIRRARLGTEAWTAASQLQFTLLQLNSGQVHAHSLKNALSLLILAGDLEMARSTFEQYKDNISGDPGGHARAYNEGVLCYFEGERAKAKSLFNAIIYSTEDNYLKADGRIYWWRAHIDGVLAGAPYDEYILRYEGQNTRKFFQRNPAFPEATRAFFQRFFTAILSLYKSMGARYGKREQQLEKTRREIELLEAHPLKTWLLQSLAATEERHKSN